MAQYSLTAQNGGPVIAFDAWVASLPEGSDKANVVRIAGLQEATWLSGNEETPHPEFVSVWSRYVEENNLIQEMVG
jgi:hypothetical protein